MTQAPPKRPWWLNLISILLFLAAIIGFFTVGKISWGIISGIHPHWSDAIKWWGGLWSGVQWFLSTQAAIWVTAIATVFLYRATRALKRATNIEHALNGPFITVSLSLADQLPLNYAPAATAPYATWVAHDAESAPLSERNQHARPQYLMLRIDNNQTRPQGAASNVYIYLTLSFGAGDDVALPPYNLPRVSGPTLVLAQHYVEGPLFNVGGLPNFKVEVTKVEYEDILNRSRTAAVGTAFIQRKLDGTMMSRMRVFEPREGEFTDGD